MNAKGKEDMNTIEGKRSGMHSSGSSGIAPSSLGTSHQGLSSGHHQREHDQRPMPEQQSESQQTKSDQMPRKDASGKSLDELETTLEGYFAYLGSKITDVATAGTAPKDTPCSSSSKNTCQVCGHVSDSWLDMRKHLRSHSDFRPYKCDLCPRSFHDLYKLKRHLVIHTGLKPYQCHICDQRLSRAEHLRRHLLIHKEQKPYKCNLCDFSARRTDSVKSHQRSRHPGEWVDVVTVATIVDIVSDETTMNTNLTPNAKLSGKKKKKKKKKKDPVAASTVAPSTSTMNTPTTLPPSQVLLTPRDVGQLPAHSSPYNLARPAQKPSTATSKTSPSSDSTVDSTPPRATTKGHGLTTEQQQQGLYVTSSQAQSGISPSSTSTASSKVGDDSPSPSRPMKMEMAAACDQRAAAFMCTPSGAYLSQGASPTFTSGPGAALSNQMSVSAQAAMRPGMRPVMSMSVDPNAQAAFNIPGSPVNYYPGLPRQFAGNPMQSPQTFAPYFAMKPVFPEAMPVSHSREGHVRGFGMGCSPSSMVKQEQANCAQSPVNMAFSPGTKMSSPNS